jgi:hypothetical protein
MIVAPNAHWCRTDLFAVPCQLSTQVPALRQVIWVIAPVRPPGEATP